VFFGSAVAPNLKLAQAWLALPSGRLPQYHSQPHHLAKPAQAHLFTQTRSSTWSPTRHTPIESRTHRFFHALTTHRQPGANSVVSSVPRQLTSLASPTDAPAHTFTQSSLDHILEVVTPSPLPNFLDVKSRIPLALSDLLARTLIHPPPSLSHCPTHSFTHLLGLSLSLSVSLTLSLSHPLHSLTDPPAQELANSIARSLHHPPDIQITRPSPPPPGIRQTIYGSVLEVGHESYDVSLGYPVLSEARRKSLPK